MAVSKRVTITGLDRVLCNLNRHIAKIPGKTKAGMKEAALLIQSESMRLTPHDTGHLKGSSYVNSPMEAANGDVGVEIGYTAVYAPYVHEINANYRRGQWKFLVTALKQNAKKILEILRKTARV